jgi:chaperonin cofactor prefoldin
MTGEERERMYELCGQIIIEQDHAKMIELVHELNDLLATKEKRLRPPSEESAS